MKFCTRSYSSCVYLMMRFKGSNGKVSKMMTSHFRTLLPYKAKCCKTKWTRARAAGDWNQAVLEMRLRYITAQRWRSDPDILKNISRSSNMIKTDKLLRLKTKKGKFLNVIREHYLRDDIACHSELCSCCDQGKLQSMLLLLTSSYKAGWFTRTTQA